MGTRSPIVSSVLIWVMAACSAQIDAPPYDPAAGGGGDGDSPADEPFRADNDVPPGNGGNVGGDGDADADADGDADGDGDGDGDGDADAEQPGGEQDVLPDAPLDGCSDAASCDQMAHQLLDALNDARAAAGAGACHGGPLAWDDQVAAVARAHSAHMAAVNQLTNADPGGGIDTRLNSAGIDWSSAGEVYGVVPHTAADTIDDWLTDARIAEYLQSCEWPLGGFGVVPGAGPQAPAWVTLTMIAP